MIRHQLVAGLLVLLLGACTSLPPGSSRAPATTGLPVSVVNMLNAANIPANAVGAVVFRLSDATTLLSHRPDASMQPGSNMKLVTTLVGLEKLGPTFRTRTEMRTVAPIDDGVLRGDLILRGGGDGDFTWEEFSRMLQTLREKGIRDIHGDLVLDRTLFQPTRIDVGVPSFDESPESEDNVIPDALLINTNLLKMEFESDDQFIRARLRPELDAVSIDMKMTLVDRACKDWDDGWQTPLSTNSTDGSIRIQLRGEYPRKCSSSTNINILDRDDQISRLFRALWIGQGGSFRGSVREGTMPADARLLAQHRSRTLADTLRIINKPSDNALARVLLLTLGSQSDSGSGTSLERAERIVRAWFKQNLISDDGLVLENGSGLSRSERIRPSQLAALLTAGYRSQWAPEFVSSLPIAGMDGTMSLRLKGSPAQGRARLKTGTLKNVVALSGYVPDASGQMHVVAAFINHHPASGFLGRTGRPILDALVDWVARSGGQ